MHRFLQGKTETIVRQKQEQIDKTYVKLELFDNIRQFGGDKEEDIPFLPVGVDGLSLVL